MILIRSKIFRYFHFVKPTLSSITNLADLQNILQKRLIRNIADVNSLKLQHYSYTNTIQEYLQLTEEAAREIEERTVKRSIVNPSTQEHHLVEARVNQDITKVSLAGVNLDLPFASSNQQLHHFSEKRGTPNFQQLHEYQLNDRTLHIFNLPENINEQDIQATLKTNEIKISFKYCILGLPAFAKVQFQSASELNACLEKVPSKRLPFGERVAFIKSPEDAAKLKLGYRRLVVELEEDSKFEHFALEFSKYGRVLHVDWPIEASLNPTIDEVKAFYKNSTELIRINKIHKDGTVQSEYYPQVNAWDKNDDFNTDNIIQRAQRLKESYEHRARFAKNVNVHVGKQHETSLTHRGYCVVTYSTYEQCQNFYFSHSSDLKLQLVGEQLDFEFDPLFKRELLRQIDNEYLLSKKSAAQQRVKHEKDYINPTNEGLQDLEFHIPTADRIDDPFFKETDEYKIFEKIFNKLCYTELTQSKEISSYYVKEFKNENIFKDWDEYIRDFKRLKRKVNRKTFDELAEIELFGRVLPKDSNIERLIVEDTNIKKIRENELIDENNLLTDFRDVMSKNKFYRRVQERNNRLGNKRQGINLEQEVEEPEGEASQIQPSQDEAAPSDGENIGKQQFSTRKPTFLYRKRTAEQEAHFQHRYQQFIRSSIYEYMGVFHDKVIEEASEFKPSIINPQSLKWPNGNSYFTEDEVLDALQFRRDYSKAQVEYEDYVYGSEYIKSSGANLTHINANFREFQNSATQYLTDFGVVEDIRKINGDNLQEKVDILNAQASAFGEFYRLQEENGQKVLVKVRKLENLLPLDRVGHMEQFIAEYGQDITEIQSQIFEKHYIQMKETGIIPDEVCDAFEVEKGKSFNDLLGEVGSVYKISKKDLEMAERAKTYSKQELNEDIEQQLKLQKIRSKHRKVGNNHFAKDPSQIYAKDREGYYKVSRYRQI